MLLRLNYIMRYYVLELKNIREDALKKYNSTINKTKKIITNDSIIKEYKNELYRYKLIDNHKDKIIKNYINDWTLAATDFYEKRIEKIFHIPFENTLIELDIKKYFIGPKTNFVIEKKDGRLQDFYFESKDDADSFSLREDIGSFLLGVM